MSFPSGKRPVRAARARPLAVEALEHRQLLTTLATFDHPPTPYIQTGPDNLQFTSLRAGGATGRYMRFMEGQQSGLASLSFDRTVAFAADVVVAEFMFRDTYTDARFDNFDFALLNTRDYGKLATRQGYDYGKGFKDSLSFRFLVDRNIRHAEEKWSDSSLQVVYDGLLIKDINLTDVYDMHSGQWHRVRFIVNAAAGTLSIDLTPEGRDPIRIAADLAIPGLTPYVSRAHFSNLRQTNAGNIDLDSIAVHYLRANESYVTFDDWRSVAQENGKPISVQLRRFGNLSTAIDVTVKTTGGSAKADVDYRTINKPITFASGEETQSVDLVMMDDFASEDNEYFWLRVNSTTSTVKTSDPVASIVRIYDDEIGRQYGQALLPIALARVPIHTVMLPNGKVMFWGRQHDLGPQLYDTVTGEVTDVPIADDHHGTGEHFNVFCSGHTLLPDGRLFVAGGHEDDFIGTKTAFIYDSATNHWIRLPDMANRRWYPTVVPLPNGDVLVLHGTIDSPTHYNEQPEVWQAATNAWRKIHIAQDLADNARAHQSNFYPRATVIPDGRVFYFGVGKETWYLDPRPGITNPWSPGPQLVTNASPYSYGTMTMYRPGKLLVVGGGHEGTAAAEVIDFNQADPKFRAVSPMHYARRQHNTTILPDGRVLITGGHAGAELSDPAAIQLKTEIWDPATEKFTVQSALSIERIYHSTGMLLPDGSVWTGGSGEPVTIPNAKHQRNAQIVQPSYLFYSNRPEITLAPSKAGLGQQIYLNVNRPHQVISANLVRLSAVTHSLEQSARFIPVNFSQAAGGLNLDIPANANTLIPGYYFLSVVDYRGVPSASKVIQILPSGGTSFVRVDDAAITEAANGSSAHFTVRLSTARATPTTIGYRTMEATAKPGADYTAMQQTITIPAGQLTGVISIPIVNDSTKEPTEWFAIDLVSATGGAIITKRRAQAVVRDDDGETQPTISIDDRRVVEGDNAVLTVRLSSPSAFSTTIPYVTTNGSADTNDYSLRAGSITIPAGKTTGQITVPTYGEGLAEGDETFFVRLVRTPNLKIGDGEARVTISDAPTPAGGKKAAGTKN